MALFSLANIVLTIIRLTKLSETIGLGPSAALFVLIIILASNASK